MKVRQDAWSHEDDLLLAETVLRHIREGGTQLNAFDEVGDALNRTSAACGFRWNAVVRDKYEDAIKLAKKHRKQRKRQLAQQAKPQYKSFEPKQEPVKAPSFMEEFSKSFEAVDRAMNKPRELSLDDVISFLQTFRENGTKSFILEEENEQLKNKVVELEEAYAQLQKEYRSVEEDYQSIIQIMDRARKMAVLEDEGVDRTAASFRMDKNGNLEKVAK
ncbi:RsfA family transcriptional regulator [Salipaludibacillus aurantiacus]|uniref:Prespore-specific regulator n=1 Tax=Salipaludibacillus aurantiacus TaxID=1601833 RepID=A0A1H9RJA7_9BACI|nr:RsfA family transcriptional regulator [Salipaludibacillus aurantiacus]SER72784.1 prespore-specific regulator [Salipaludibacillus aurantiacus]